MRNSSIRHHMQVAKRVAEALMHAERIDSIQRACCTCTHTYGALHPRALTVAVYQSEGVKPF